VKIYIAGSWKHQHLVEMLTAELRAAGHEVFSFVENNFGEHDTLKRKDQKPLPFDEWVWSDAGVQSYNYDTGAAIGSHVVIYVGPSGKDAAFECGMAKAKGAELLGLYAKAEDFGLMRRAFKWLYNYRDLLAEVERLAADPRVAGRIL
jgi:hypothetical protein